MYRGQTGGCGDVLRVEKRLWLCKVGRQEAVGMCRGQTGGYGDAKRAERRLW